MLAKRAFAAPLSWSLMLVVLVSASCGAGTVGLASAVGDRGGDVNAPPQLSGVLVYSARTSPAVVQFDLRDAESEPVSISVTYRSQVGAPLRRATLIPGDLRDLDGELRQATLALDSVATSPGGRRYHLLWDFAQDGLGLGGTEQGVEVLLDIVAGGGSSQPPLEPGPTGVTVGNDPPQPRFVELQDELSGIALVTLAVDDPNGDSVRVTVEYQIQGEPGCDAWQLARPAQLPPGEPTTGGQVDTDGDGEREDFFWATEFEISTPDPGCDLAGRDRSVKLRLTALEQLAHAGGGATDEDLPREVTVQSVVVSVDNNLQPIAVVDEASLVLNPDQRRGILVPFSVLDDESDRIRVALQWRRETEAFPPCPESASELLALLQDPSRSAERLAAQLGREVPLAFRGRVGRLDPPRGGDQVRLPELAAGASGLLQRGLAGRILDLLRPDPISYPTWPGKPVRIAVDALPRGDGRRALTLEQDGANWRVLEVELATGATVDVVSGPGMPRALTFDPFESILFVASELGIERFSAATGARLGSVANPFQDGPRDIVALGRDVLLATGDDEVVSLDYRPSGVRQALVEGLAMPWGLAVSSRSPGTVYLAEHGADRVLTLEVATARLEVVPARVREDDEPALGVDPFPAPRALALESGGRRLLVGTETASGASLRGLELGEPRDGRCALASPYVFEIASEIDEPTATLSTGPDGQRLVATSTGLAVGGGLQRSAKISSDSVLAYAPSTQTVVLDQPLDPPVQPGTRWRIRTPLLDVASNPAGSQSSYLWDSSEVPAGGRVQVRILPIDNDLGIAAPVTGFKDLPWGLDVEARALALPSHQVNASLAVGDLDGDGDLDIVTANDFADPVVDDIRVFTQTGPGQFVLTETLTDPGVVSPRAVALGDLDSDGDRDIVSANHGSNDPTTGSLTVFWQQGCSFGGPATTLGDLGSPRSVAVADVDGDRRDDIVSANFHGDDLQIFRQVSGGFDRRPPLSRNVSSPRSVALGDLDGDGDLDLVAANEAVASGNLTVFFREGPDYQPSEILFEHVEDPSFVAVGDLDGDGALDLVAANEDGASPPNLTLLYQDPPGIFTPRSPDRLTHPDFAGIPTVAIADLDGDGDVDVVATGALSDRLIAFLQDGSGAFVASASRAVSDPTIVSPRMVVAADLDGDGDTDLASANAGRGATPGTLTVLPQTSPGEFTTEGVGLPDVGPLDPQSVAAGDLDRDGDLDLVTIDSAGERMTIFFQTRPGSFQEHPEGPIDTVNDPHSVSVADLDGDGDLDIVAAIGASTPRLRLYFQEGQGDERGGDFGPPVVLMTDPHFPSFVEAADLDDDGDMDLLATALDSDALLVWLQGPGGFEPAPFSPVIDVDIDCPNQLVVDDIDRDGRQDVVIANACSDSVTILFQTTEGDLQLPDEGRLRAGADLDSPRGVAVADLDGDGDLDIASANAMSDNLTVFFQEPGGAFVLDPRGPLTGLTSPEAVVAGDIDGDGDQDLAAASTGDDRIVIFFQTAPGRFEPSPHPSLTTRAMARPLALAIGDLDLDGDLDLVSANGQGERVSIFFGFH